MKKFIHVSFFIVALLVAGKVAFAETTPSSVGGQTDSHGCYTSAGYVWDATAQKCTRQWESTSSSTVANPVPMPGSDRDSHGCIGSAGYTWNDKDQKCERPWENNQRGSPQIDCEVSVQDLKFGDGEKNNKHEDVKSLQKYLINLGILKVPTATGYFGRATRDAVMRYQKENKIQATGYMGSLTKRAMKNHGCKEKKVEIGETDFPGCKTWFDGCNTCSRGEPGKPAACTLMACAQGGDEAWFAAHKPYCKEYFKD